MRYKPLYWMSSTRDRIPFRAQKQLGPVGAFIDSSNRFRTVFSRFKGVARGMGQTLQNDLARDVHSTIDDFHGALQFIVEATPDAKSPDDLLIELQAWEFALTEEGRREAGLGGCDPESTIECMKWLAANRDWPTPRDPTNDWKTRMGSLQDEKSRHRALKRYCDFMKQTENIRSQVAAAAASADAAIQRQIDDLRGK